MLENKDKKLFSAHNFSLKPVRDLHVNNWFVVRKRGTYFTVEYKYPQVMILPIVGKDSMLLVKVKRPVIADNTWELPAGSVKRREKIVSAASRELLEETGIDIKDERRFIALPSIANSPNRNPKLINIFKVLVAKKEFDNRLNYDGEIEKIECFSPPKIKKMLLAGEIYVGVPAAVIGRYLLMKSRG